MVLWKMNPHSQYCENFTAFVGFVQDTPQGACDFNYLFEGLSLGPDEHPYATDPILQHDGHRGLDLAPDEGALRQGGGHLRPQQPPWILVDPPLDTGRTSCALLSSKLPLIGSNPAKF